MRPALVFPIGGSTTYTPSPRMFPLIVHRPIIRRDRPHALLREGLRVCGGLLGSGRRRVRGAAKEESVMEDAVLGECVSCPGLKVSAELATLLRGTFIALRSVSSTLALLGSTMCAELSLWILSKSLHLGSVREKRTAGHLVSRSEAGQNLT